MSRIMYPEDFASQRKLFKDIKAKDTADGALSKDSRKRTVLR